MFKFSYPITHLPEGQRLAQEICDTHPIVGLFEESVTSQAKRIAILTKSRDDDLLHASLKIGEGLQLEMDLNTPLSPTPESAEVFSRVKAHIRAGIPLHPEPFTPPWERGLAPTVRYDILYEDLMDLVLIADSVHLSGYFPSIGSRAEIHRTEDLFCDIRTQKVSDHVLILAAGVAVGKTIVPARSRKAVELYHLYVNNLNGIIIDGKFGHEGAYNLFSKTKSLLIDPNQGVAAVDKYMRRLISR